MNLANWSVYSFTTFLAVIWRSLINALSGALGGLVVVLIYSTVVGIMGGVKCHYPGKMQPRRIYKLSQLHYRFSWIQRF
jgi:hypothetical protein